MFPIKTLNVIAVSAPDMIIWKKLMHGIIYMENGNDQIMEISTTQRLN